MLPNPVGRTLLWKFITLEPLLTSWLLRAQLPREANIMHRDNTTTAESFLGHAAECSHLMALTPLCAPLGHHEGGLNTNSARLPWNTAKAKWFRLFRRSATLQQFMTPEASSPSSSANYASRKKNTSRIHIRISAEETMKIKYNIVLSENNSAFLPRKMFVFIFLV